MSVKINRVRVKNFRSLKSVETTLGEVTLLIGTNNAGKTSFLRALSVALASDRKFISKDDIFIDKDGNYPDIPKILIDIEVIPDDEKNFPPEWVQEVFGDNIQLKINNDEFFAYRTIIDFSSKQKQAQINRYLITDWDSDVADENQEVTAKLSKLPLFFIDAQRDLQDDLKYAQSYFGRLASEIDYDKDKKEELEDSLSTLNKETVKHSEVLKHLKKSLEELNKTVQTKGSGVEITPFPKKLRDLHKGLKVNYQDGGSETFSLEYHGMGTRSWASLLGYKAYVNWMKQKADKNNDVLHPILALEEPEAHLHPNAQRQVYSQLTDVTGQKIISTHSPFIAPLAKLSELRVFYKEGDSTNIGDLQSLIDAFDPKQIKSLEANIIKTRGELLFAKLVVLFEGQTEDAALPIFAKEHWGINAYEKGVSFISIGGPDYKLYIILLEALKVPWIIFSDYDNPKVQSRVEAVGKELKTIDINTDDRFILLNYSIEEYLITEGYRENLEQAIFDITEPIYANEKHKKTKEPERIAYRENLQNMTDDDLLSKKVKSLKAKIAPFWAESIINHTDTAKKIPPKIKDLFNTIDKYL